MHLYIRIFVFKDRYRRSSLTVSMGDGQSRSYFERAGAVSWNRSYCQSNDGSRNVNSDVECGPNIGKHFVYRPYRRCIPSVFLKNYSIYHILTIARLYTFIKIRFIIIYNPFVGQLLARIIFGIVLERTENDRLLDCKYLKWLVFYSIIV